MPITPSQIKARYRIFENVDDADLQIFIDQAEIEVTAQWGPFESEGVMMLACGLCADAPEAFPMLQEPETDDNRWIKRFKELRIIVGSTRSPY